MIKKYYFIIIFACIAQLNPQLPPLCISHADWQRCTACLECFLTSALITAVFHYLHFDWCWSACLGGAGPPGYDCAQRQGHSPYQSGEEHPGGSEASLHCWSHLRLPDGRKAVSHPGVPEWSVWSRVLGDDRRCTPCLMPWTCVHLCRRRTFHAAGEGGHLHGGHSMVSLHVHATWGCADTSADCHDMKSLWEVLITDWLDWWMSTLGLKTAQIQCAHCDHSNSLHPALSGQSSLGTNYRLKWLQITVAARLLVYPHGSRADKRCTYLSSRKRQAYLPTASNCRPLRWSGPLLLWQPARLPSRCIPGTLAVCCQLYSLPPTCWTAHLFLLCINTNLTKLRGGEWPPFSLTSFPFQSENNETWHLGLASPLFQAAWLYLPQSSLSSNTYAVGLLSISQNIT